MTIRIFAWLAPLQGAVCFVPLRVVSLALNHRLMALKPPAWLIDVLTIVTSNITHRRCEQVVDLAWRCMCWLFSHIKTATASPPGCSLPASIPTRLLSD